MKTFRIGGIHPKDHKISSKEPITTANLPELVNIFTAQHIGAPATPIVQKGDVVKVGDLIAEATGFVSANVHAPVSGTVTAVANIKDAGGIAKQAITIKVEDDVWNENIDRSETIVRQCSLTPQEIVAKVKEAGIVGLGGATFPAYIKLTPPPDTKAEALVVNAVECEPFLTADHRLMLEKPEQIIIGCQIVMKAVGVEKCYIGIENNKPDAVEALRKYATEGIEIVPLKMMYPQGGEKQLIDATMNRQVPSGKLPIQVGAVVQNVGTIFAIYEAVQKNKPLVDRVVTVTGKHLKTPKNLLARIGTPIDELIEFCGGESDKIVKVVNGGPMMGRAMATTKAPVTKGTSGVLLLSAKETVREKETACISCGKCVEACPMGLEPYLFYKLAHAKMYDRLEQEKLPDCIECGCCTFSCPSALPLLDYIKISRAETLKLIRERNTPAK